MVLLDVSITTLCSNLIKFIKEYWDIITAILVVVWTIFKYIWELVNGTVRQRKAVALLEMYKEHFSNKALDNLNNENEFIKFLTLNIFPEFWGISYENVKRIFDVKLNSENNFFDFIKFYKKGWVDITGTRTKEYDGYHYWTKPVLVVVIMIFIFFIISKYLTDYKQWFFYSAIIPVELIVLYHYETFKKLKNFSSYKEKYLVYNIDINGKKFVAKVSISDK